MLKYFCEKQSLNASLQYNKPYNYTLMFCHTRSTKSESFIIGCKLRNVLSFNSLFNNKFNWFGGIYSELQLSENFATDVFTAE